jgi:anti-repressor protein
MSDLIKIENITMSSLEIAELVESRHDKVKQSIERLVERGVISQPPVGDGPKSSNGVVIRVYLLSKRDSYVVVAQLSPEFTARLVDRWQELETKIKPAIPTSYSEALKLAYEQALVIEDQNKRLIEKDSLIIASNEASIKAGEILVREFVKSVDIIDLGERQFYQWMRDQGIIMESREPYQQYVNRGFFTWKPTDVEHGGKYRYTLRVTPRGKVWLSARYLAWLDRDMGDAA